MPPETRGHKDASTSADTNPSRRLFSPPPFTPAALACHVPTLPRSHAPRLPRSTRSRKPPETRGHEDASTTSADSNGSTYASAYASSEAEAEAEAGTPDTSDEEVDDENDGDYARSDGGASSQDLSPSPVPSPIFPSVSSPIVLSVPPPIVPSVPSPIVPSVPSPIVPSVPSPNVPSVPSPVVSSVSSPFVSSVPSPIVPSVPSPIVSSVPSPSPASRRKALRPRRRRPSETTTTVHTSVPGATIINHASSASPRNSAVLYAITAAFTVLTAVFVVSWAGGVIAVSRPHDNLQNYVKAEVGASVMAKIGDIVVDDYNLYAQSICVEGGDAETIRRGLRANLKVPSEVAEEIIRSAVVDKLSCTNSMQNTTASIANNGKAFSYMAYWSTVYVARQGFLPERYSSCVMAAGISLLVGEELSGFEERSDSVVVGSEPCLCGFLRCAQCPIMRERVTKTPIFKRNKLTLDGQISLHRFMEASAFKSALALGNNRRSLSGMLFGDRDSVTATPMVERWKEPSGNVFLGTVPPPPSMELTAGKTVEVADV